MIPPNKFITGVILEYQLAMAYSIINLLFHAQRIIVFSYKKCPN